MKRLIAGKNFFLKKKDMIKIIYSKNVTSVGSGFMVFPRLIWKDEKG